MRSQSTFFLCACSQLLPGCGVRWWALDDIYLHTFQKPFHSTVELAPLVMLQNLSLFHDWFVSLKASAKHAYWTHPVLWGQICRMPSCVTFLPVTSGRLIWCPSWTCLVVGITEFNGHWSAFSLNAEYFSCIRTFSSIKSSLCKCHNIRLLYHKLPKADCNRWSLWRLFERTWGEAWRSVTLPRHHRAVVCLRSMSWSW